MMQMRMSGKELFKAVYELPSVAPKQEPCEDAVSREVILGKIKEVCFSEEWTQFRVDNGSNGQRDFLINYIEQLPPVTPKQEPCKETVSLGVFEQVMWERDVAIDQLKELGYGFGEKPNTGHWIVLSATDMCCSECNEIEHLDTSRRFCAYCGTRMSENPTDSESEE